MLCLFLNKTLSQCYFHSLEQCDGVLYTIVRHDMNVGFRPQKKLAAFNLQYQVHGGTVWYRKTVLMCVLSWHKK